MAVIVVGGSGQGAGKTALVCGVIAALAEFGWTAVKITNHAHGQREAIWEERDAGRGTDTARYLAAGARRALLVTAGDDELALRLGQLEAMLEPGAHVIYESNRIVEHVRADVCLAVGGDAEGVPKPSFRGLVERADAMVSREGAKSIDGGSKRLFRLARLDSIS
ncbi:MAG: hypothetical protein KGM96_11850, partial [Acidobacteriota bacterium]|nr:hypothetical protein [Acidobacteriota bacterium]